MTTSTEEELAVTAFEHEADISGGNSPWGPRSSMLLSIVDQAALSLFNLAVNLALVRLAGPSEFGLFLFAAAVILIMTSVQNATVASPITIILPHRPAGERSEGFSAVMSFNWVVMVLSAVLGALLCLLASANVIYLAASAAAVFTTLMREAARSVHIVRGRLGSFLALDVVSIVASALVSVLAWNWVQPATACLVGIAIGNLVAVILAARGIFSRPLSVMETFEGYRTFWKDTRWSLLGATTTELQSRFYVFALEAFCGLAVLGQIQAGRLLLGPLPLLVGAWGRVARPAMAISLAAGDVDRAKTTFKSGIVLIISAALAFCALLYFAWPLVETWVYANKYPDIGSTAAAWAAFTLISMTQVSVSYFVLAANRLKELAFASVLSASVSCTLLLSLGFGVNPIYSIVFLAVGECLALAYVATLAYRVAWEGRRTTVITETGWADGKSS